MPRIMLIEDDPTMVLLLKLLLEMEGYEVSLYGDATQAAALSAMLAEPPDLILLDINLQRMNGLELLKQMRLDARLNAVKVVMTSGYDSSDTCLKAGANAFLLKPYMPDDLIGQIKKEITKSA